MHTYIAQELYSYASVWTEQHLNNIEENCVLHGGPDHPTGRGTFGVIVRHAQTCRQSIFLTLFAGSAAMQPVCSTAATCSVLLLVNEIDSELLMYKLEMDAVHTHTHMFKGPFSGTTRVSRYQKGKTSLDFTEARDSEW